jgi:hypothetical protein
MANFWKQSGFFFLCATILLSATLCFAADKEHGTVIGPVTLYVAPDASSQKLGNLTRGRDIYLMDHTTVDGKPWSHLLAIVSVDVERETSREISGWVNSNVVITISTPNGDQIIYGEAADSEAQAEVRGGRKHAAEDAMRLYYRLFEYFPNSPLAGEALWRAADIRWQLEKSDVLTRPSAHEMDPDLRNAMDDQTMKLVQKKFPHSKWADLASYDLIDNKLCGSWKGEAHCPEKESDLYEKYAREHPTSPKVAEALYNSLFRQAALVDIYKATHEQDKSDHAKKKAMELAQELASKYPEGDWKPRALELNFALQQNIPIYGQGGISPTK